jgi:cysteine desulfurase
VQGVVRITSEFQQESPLNSTAKKVLDQLFDKGWADPEKINQESREVALLLNEARNTFAKFLEVRSDEIEFLGEINIGFHLGISGLLKPNSKLFFSKIDKQSIFAVANHWENAGHKVINLDVDHHGQIENFQSEDTDLLIWQVANGETGIIQHNPESKSLIFADCTSSGIDYLPKFDYQTALFDSKSWQGPSGLGVLVIKKQAQWNNPLPHNDYVRVPNTFSVPLVLASAVALEAYVLEKERISGFKSRLLSQLDQSKLNFQTPTSESNLPKFLNLIFPNIEADRLVLELQDAGFTVDSGSACRSADMQPSHVLSAMKYPTNGSIRITFHPQITEDKVFELGKAIIASVEKLTN